MPTCFRTHLIRRHHPTASVSAPALAPACPCWRNRTSCVPVSCVSEAVLQGCLRSAEKGWHGRSGSRYSRGDQRRGCAAVGAAARFVGAPPSKGRSCSQRRGGLPQPGQLLLLALQPRRQRLPHAAVVGVHPLHLLLLRGGLAGDGGRSGWVGRGEQRGPTAAGARCSAPHCWLFSVPRRPSGRPPGGSAAQNRVHGRPPARHQHSVSPTRTPSQAPQPRSHPPTHPPGSRARSARRG